MTIRRRLFWRLRGAVGAPEGFTLRVAAVAALGALLVAAREYSYGVSVSWDSLQYLGVATNLLAGAGFTNYDGTPYTVWPPLYPMLLAYGGLGLAAPLAVAGPLNIAAFGLTIFVVGRYLGQRLESRFAAAWACVAIALSAPLGELAAWALAGAPFILLATLALTQADRYRLTGSLWALAWATLFTALAWQTRYMGVTLAVVVGLVVLFGGNVGVWRRILRAGVFGLAAGAPMAAWLWRNYAIIGELTGNRGAEFSLTEAVWATLELAGEWAQTDMALFGGAWAAIGLAAIAVGLAVGYIYAPRGFKRQAGFDWWGCRIFGGFGALYLATLIALIALGQSWDGVQWRYVARAYVPAVVAAAFAADWFLGWARERSGTRASVAAVVVVVAMAAWAAALILPKVENIRAANSGELYMGYSAPRWAGSETLRHIRAHPIGGRVYSNEAALLHFHNSAGDLHQQFYLSRPEGSRGGVVLGTAQEQIEEWLEWAVEGDHIVWFNNWWNQQRYGYGAGDLRASERLLAVGEFEDGVILRVEPVWEPLSYDVRVDLGGREVTYYREPCEEEEVVPHFRFVLHTIPADVWDLPPERRFAGFGNHDFSIGDDGVVGGYSDGACFFRADLPRYDLELVRMGQYNLATGKKMWRVEFYGDELYDGAGLARADYGGLVNPYAAARDAALSGDSGEPAARSRFDVYIQNGTVVYYRWNCEAADVRARFFLHTRRAAGGDYERKEFAFSDYGVNIEGDCVAQAALPAYEIGRVRTGQYGGSDDWTVEFAVGDN